MGAKEPIVAPPGFLVALSQLTIQLYNNDNGHLWDWLLVDMWCCCTLTDQLEMVLTAENRQ